MGIPAREEFRIVTAHKMTADNEILDDPVHGCAGMQVIVGIRRTVMQDERCLSLMPLYDFMVEILLFPFCQNARFLLGEVAPHFKTGLRHVQCILVVHTSILPDYLI